MTRNENGFPEPTFRDITENQDTSQTEKDIESTDISENNTPAESVICQDKNEEFDTTEESTNEDETENTNDEETEDKAENTEPETSESDCGNPDDGTLNDKPLAFSYTPIQRFRMLYSYEEALNRGTLFEELDKPTEVYGND